VKTGFLAWIAGTKFSTGLDSIFLCIKAETEGRHLDKLIKSLEQDLAIQKKELLSRELEVLLEEKKQRIKRSKKHP
jgi:hypothetical protein